MRVRHARHMSVIRACEKILVMLSPAIASKNVTVLRHLSLPPRVLRLIILRHFFPCRVMFIVHTVASVVCRRPAFTETPRSMIACATLFSSIAVAAFLMLTLSHFHAKAGANIIVVRHR